MVYKKLKSADRIYGYLKNAHNANKSSSYNLNPKLLFTSLKAIPKMLRNDRNNLVISNCSKNELSYNLKRCQINTPHEVVIGFWELIKRHRDVLEKVVDIGAGDGRFSLRGNFSYYEGFEIDRRCQKLPKMPRNSIIRYGCAFDYPHNNYDACIGNPPYVRHHDIEPEWRENVVNYIRDELQISLNRSCNLFVYFMCLGLIKTKSNGLVALIVPYEWVSSPSVLPLRNYINNKGWGVHVYRFKDEIFDGVLTTASITVIDKNERVKRWKFYDIDTQFNVYPKRNMSGTNCSVLPYEERSKIWAMRGLSPGTQKVFTLTEGERIHFGLRKFDVSPCITTLRNISGDLRIFNETTFKKYFVDAGQKCWLIKSYKSLSKSLNNYLDHVPKNLRETSTCRNQNPWYKYTPHPSPKILYGSGFTTFGPKFLINKVNAIAVGSVHGIHFKIKVSKKYLVEYLTEINFGKRVVSHAGVLKKVEVKQMNGILNKYLLKRKNNGKKAD